MNTPPPMLYSIDGDFYRARAHRKELADLLGLDESQFRYFEKKGVFEALDEIVYNIDPKTDSHTRADHLKYNTKECILGYINYLKQYKEALQTDISKLRASNTELMAIDRNLRSELGVLKDTSESLAKVRAQRDKLLERNRVLRHQLKEVSGDARAYKKLKKKQEDQACYLVDVHECARFFGVESQDPSVENPIYVLLSKGALVKRGENQYDLQKSAQAMIAYHVEKTRQECSTRDASSASTQQLSEILGLTDSRIYRLHQAGIVVKREKNDWDLVASVRNYIAYKLETEETDLQSARARKELADAKLKELNYQQKMGELLSFDLIAKTLEDIALTISNKLYALPQILKRKHHLSDEVDASMAHEIELILQELKDPAIYEQASLEVEERKERIKKRDLTRSLFEQEQEEEND
ncbi:hypothetical protein [Helicobacter salomonis]|uniref:hypothetical protein n=1 Tax=Helicobacter salomonis TaxID=56878 RepID=UPI0018F84213|nr:hypothetical protein [Helicobacter salomonis]